MKLEFEESQASYDSGSQQARVWTEQWVADWMFCPNCGAPKLTPFPANTPVADFQCPHCADQFELKSKNAKSFGRVVPYGAYDAKIARLSSNTNPNLLLLGYDKASKAVRNVVVVPKHFFTPEIIQKRAPLRPTARKAGWVGSNILLERVPDTGRIFILKDGIAASRDEVLDHWQRTSFLLGKSAEARGWLIEVMGIVDRIVRPNFTLAEVYSFETHLSRLYPENNNVRPKIRQQLQVLRDNGYLDFLGEGHYRLR